MPYKASVTLKCLPGAGPAATHTHTHTHTHTEIIGSLLVKSKAEMSDFSPASKVAKDSLPFFHNC